MRTPTGHIPTDLVVMVIAAALALWVALSCVLALVIGSAIHLADHRDGPASSP
ncbi:MAG: hypothetical protein INR66_12545 [Gordonia polyisoprenivorans]|nr:hypothetical protein [Gordonia polyisoprenivorans]